MYALNKHVFEVYLSHVLVRQYTLYAFPGKVICKWGIQILLATWYVIKPNVRALPISHAANSHPRLCKVLHIVGYYTKNTYVLQRFLNVILSVEIMAYIISRVLLISATRIRYHVLRSKYAYNGFVVMLIYGLKFTMQGKGFTFHLKWMCSTTLQ